MMKRRRVTRAVTTGCTGILTALAACALPSAASALTPLGPPSPPVTFQSGNFSQDALYDARGGWVSGLSSTFLRFTMSAQGGVGQGAAFVGL